MSRKELDKLDDLMSEKYGAVDLHCYGDGPFEDHMRVYESTTQRIPVEIRGDKYAIYTHHESGGAS